MIEARVFTDSLDHTKTVLRDERATLKGRYVIDDTIYRNVDESISLIDEFLRLRVIPENIWDEKAVILALKQTRLHNVGKDSDIPLKLQFDTKDEAEAYYDQHLKDKFIRAFSFSRIGWQYVMQNGDIVDLEIVEQGLPSIEFKSDTDEGVQNLLSQFNVNRQDVISGPSVVAVKDKLAL